MHTVGSGAGKGDPYPRRTTLPPSIASPLLPLAPAARGVGWGARRGGLRAVQAGAHDRVGYARCGLGLRRLEQIPRRRPRRGGSSRRPWRRGGRTSAAARPLAPCGLTCWDWRCVRPWQALAEAAACAGGERRGRCFNFFRGKKCQLRNRTVADRRGRGGWRRREETQEVDTRD